MKPKMAPWRSGERLAWLCGLMAGVAFMALPAAALMPSPVSSASMFAVSVVMGAGAIRAGCEVRAARRGDE